MQGADLKASGSLDMWVTLLLIQHHFLPIIIHQYTYENELPTVRTHSLCCENPFAPFIVS